jgi:hypothetical protein
MSAALFAAAGAAFLILVVVLVLPREWQLTVLVVVCALPLTIGALGPYSEAHVVEIVAFPLLALVALEMMRSQRALVRVGTGLLWMAVGFLVFIAAFNLVRTQGQAVSANRAQFDLFVGVAVFIVAAWLTNVSASRSGALTRLLEVLLWAGMAAVLLRAGSYYAGVRLPFLGGTFDYGGTRLLQGVPVERIGGLAEAGTLVLASSAGLWLATRRRALPLTGLAVGLGSVLLSGGRSFAIGVMVAGIVFLVEQSPRLRRRYVAGVVAVLVVGMMLAYATDVNRQLRRLFELAGGLARQDPYRTESITILWHQFLAHPLVGKGIGIPVPGIVNAFVNKQVTYGGHGAYASMAANFGVFGVFVIATLVFGVIAYCLLGAARQQGAVAPNSDVLAVFGFVLVYVTILAVSYAVSENGYSDPMLFAVGGLVAGVWRSPQQVRRQLAEPDARRRQEQGQ